MKFLEIGLSAYLVFIPFLLLIFGAMILKDRKFLTQVRLISWLGESKRSDHKLVNFLFSAFGFLSLFLAWGVVKTFPNHLFSQMGFLCLFLTSLSCLLIGLFPRDKEKEVHGILGTLLSAGVIGAVLFLTYPIYISPLIPNVLIILNLLILFFTSLYLALTAFKNLRPVKKALLIRTTHYQWVMFTLSIFWNFLIGLVVLKALNSF